MCIINCNSVLGDSYVFGNSFHQPLWCWACRRVSSVLAWANWMLNPYSVPDTTREEGMWGERQREGETESPFMAEAMPPQSMWRSPTGARCSEAWGFLLSVQRWPLFSSGGHLNKVKLCFGPWHRLIWGYHVSLFLSLPPYLGLPIYLRSMM